MVYSESLPNGINRFLEPIDKYKQVRFLFSNLLIPVKGQERPESFRKLRAKVGTHPGQIAFPSEGHSHPPSLTRQGIMQAGHQCQVHFSGMWEETESPEETMQTWGEHTDDTVTSFTVPLSYTAGL